ncbi:MAG TPA: hypothetical protein VJC37_08665, partial [Planctomycetota bacterium]|nr:hypothetical protein [Planctomycetota bacterium]
PPCHNPAHPHHNHPAHDHDCQLCQSAHNSIQSPYQNDSLSLDLSCVTSLQSCNDILFNAPVNQSIDIRGPPVL